MPLSRTLPVVFACSALITGCGGGDNADSSSASSCGAQFNPAAPVLASFSTFDITEPARVERNLFRDVIAGVQPSGADSQDVADSVRDLTAEFNGGQTSADQTGYTAVRNPIDLMSLIIGEGTIDNFNVGRRYISSCIDAGNAAEYSSGANGVLITFEESEGPKAEYNYPNLRWVYAPDTSGKVIRVVRFQGRSEDFLDGSAVGVQYDDASFSDVGFNTPELIQASFTGGNNEERLGLEQAFIGLDKDQWIRSSDNTFQFAGQTVDCARVIVDYRGQTAETFTSSYSSVSGSYDTRDEYVQSDDYCGNFAEGDGSSYSTEAVPARQQ